RQTLLRNGVEAASPVGRSQEVRGLCGGADHPPGAIVRGVTAPGLGGLDLRAFPPLVVARDRDDVGGGGDRSAPEPVVRRAVRALTPAGDLARPPPVIARTDARGANEVRGVRLRAQPYELAGTVRAEVVRVDTVEVGRRRKTDELGAGEESEGRRGLALQRRPLRRQEVARVVDVDIA